MRSSNVEKQSSFPWTITITDLAILCRNQPIIRPLQTTITIALNHKTEVYTQKKYDNFETINEDDSSRRGSRESKRAKDKKRPFSDEATGGDATETDSVAPPVKRKVQLSRDVVTMSLHMDTSPIYIALGVQYIPMMTRDLDTLSAILAAMKNPAESCVVDDEKPIDNTNIKEFLEYESNSESSKNLERVECGECLFIFKPLLLINVLKIHVQKFAYIRRGNGVKK